jgi:ParB-like chromosome segregation protein Spo0J
MPMKKRESSEPSFFEKIGRTISNLFTTPPAVNPRLGIPQEVATRIAPKVLETAIGLPADGATAMYEALTAGGKKALGGVAEQARGVGTLLGKAGDPLRRLGESYQTAQTEWNPPREMAVPPPAIPITPTKPPAPFFIPETQSREALPSLTESKGITKTAIDDIWRGNLETAFGVIGTAINVQFPQLIPIAGVAGALREPVLSVAGTVGGERGQEVADKVMTLSTNLAFGKKFAVAAALTEQGVNGLRAYLDSDTKMSTRDKDLLLEAANLGILGGALFAMGGADKWIDYRAKKSINEIPSNAQPIDAYISPDWQGGQNKQREIEKRGALPKTDNVRESIPIKTLKQRLEELQDEIQSPTGKKVNIGDVNQRGTFSYPELTMAQRIEQLRERKRIDEIEAFRKSNPALSPAEIEMFVSQGVVPPGATPKNKPTPPAVGVPEKPVEAPKPIPQPPPMPKKEPAPVGPISKPVELAPVEVLERGKNGNPIQYKSKYGIATFSGEGKWEVYRGGDRFEIAKDEAEAKRIVATDPKTDLILKVEPVPPKAEVPVELSLEEQEAIYRKDAQSLGIDYRGMQEGWGDIKDQPLFHDNKTGDTFTPEKGESLADALVRVRAKFPEPKPAENIAEKPKAEVVAKEPNQMTADGLYQLGLKYLLQYSETPPTDLSKQTEYYHVAPEGYASGAPILSAKDLVKNGGKFTNKWTQDYADYENSVEAKFVSLFENVASAYRFNVDEFSGKGKILKVIFPEGTKLKRNPEGYPIASKIESKNIVEEVKNLPEYPDLQKPVGKVKGADNLQSILDRLQKNEDAINVATQDKGKAYFNPRALEILNKEKGQLLDEYYSETGTYRSDPLSFERQQQKPVEKPGEGVPEKPVEAEQAPEAQVREIPISEIQTDTKRFQPRVKGINEETQQQRVKNFKRTLTELNPIKVWKDPVDGIYKVLAGHHRLDLFKRMGEKNIPAFEYRGTEKEARAYAANEQADAEAQTAIDRASYYHNKRVNGEMTQSQIKEEAHRLHGRNAPSYISLSFLNPRGKAIEALEALGEEVSDNSRSAKTIAEWIGTIRQEHKGLTNAHENEIYNYLLENYKTAGKGFTSKSAFRDYVDTYIDKNKVNGEIDPNKILNLNNFVHKSPGVVEYENQIAVAEDVLSKAETALRARRAYYIRSGITSEAQLVQGLAKETDAVTKAHEKLVALRDAKDAVVGKLHDTELSLFDQIDTHEDVLKKQGVSDEQFLNTTQRPSNAIEKSQPVIDALKDQARDASTPEQAKDIESKVDAEIEKIAGEKPKGVDPQLLEMRRTILPEYNQHPEIERLDGFVDSIRELDPKNESDAIDIEHGYKYEVTISYPHSLGENGNRTEFSYKTRPTPEEIAQDLRDTYKDEKIEINKELVNGVVAKSGRDENIEQAIDKALAGGTVPEQQLIDAGLLKQKYNDPNVWQYKNSLESGWMTANSKEGAIESANEAFGKLKPEERISQTERDANADKAKDAELLDKYKNLSDKVIQNKLSLNSVNQKKLNERLGSLDVNQRGSARSATMTQQLDALSKENADLERVLDIRKNPPSKGGIGGAALSIGGDVVANAVIQNSNLSDDEKKRYSTLINMAMFAGLGAVMAKGATGQKIRELAKQAKEEWIAKGTDSQFFKNWFGNWGKSTPDVFWHGSPSGDLRGSAVGLHIGTYDAAKQALNARIGIPAEGEWDGTREYGKTLLAGQKTLKEIDPRGYNVTGFNTDAPVEDYYPSGKAEYGDQSPIPITVKPDIFPVRIKGKMSNTKTTPHKDFRANGYMSAQLKKGVAKSGYYYENVGEDAGSVSAVLPNGSHIERLQRIITGASKVVDDNGKPLVVYSGHSNTPLYKNFDPKKGTAGGFYASEDPQIASNYANSKFGGKEYYENGNQYRLESKSGEYNKKIWQVELTDAQKTKLAELMKEKDEYGDSKNKIAEMDTYIENNAPYDKDVRRWKARGGSKDLQSVYEWMEQMGYTISYPKEGATSETPFFERQQKNDFEELLDNLDIKWQSYDWNQPGVLPVYMNIRNPLDADRPFPQDLLKALKDKAKGEHERTFRELSYATWTKDYPLKEWIKDIESGNEGWTTQIPKKALPILKQFGYDGIKERGNKGADLPREQRGINWIAFEPEQIKSAIANKGTFAGKDMLSSLVAPIAYGAGSTIIDTLPVDDDTKKRLKFALGATIMGGFAVGLAKMSPGGIKTFSEYLEKAKGLVKDGKLKEEEMPDWIRREAVRDREAPMAERREVVLTVKENTPEIKKAVRAAKVEGVQAASSGRLQLNPKEKAEFSESDLNDVKNLRDIGKRFTLDLDKTLGTDVRTGLIKRFKRRAIGLFFPDSGLIRVRNINELDVLAHEVGHDIDANVFQMTPELKYRKGDAIETTITLNLGKFKTDPVKKAALLDRLRSKYGTDVVDAIAHRYELRQELKQMLEREGYPQVTLPEGIAEFVSKYVVEPETLIKQTPQFYSFFENLLSQNDNLKEALHTARKEFKEFSQQDPRQLTEATIARPEKETWLSGIKKINLKELYYDVVSGVAPFRELSERLKKDSPVTGDKDPLYQVLSTLGIEGKLRMYLEHHPFLRQGNDIKILDDVPGLLTTFQQMITKGTLKSHEGYLTALHNIELIKAEKSKASTTSLEIAEKTKELYEQDFTKDYGKDYAKTLTDDLRKYNSSLLRYYYESGKLSKEAYDKSQELYKYYVPFKRFFDEFEVQGQFPNVSQFMRDIAPSPVKRIKGSRREILSPVESLVRNTHELILAADKNTALNTIVESLKKLDPQIVQKIPPTVMKPVRVFEDGELSEVKFTPVTERPKGKAIVTVFENGKPQFYEIPKTYYDSFFALYEPYSKALRALAIPVQVLRSGAVVYDPTFGVRNISRDQMSGLFYSKHGYNPYHFIKGIFSLAKKDEAYQKYLASGADISFLANTDEIIKNNISAGAAAGHLQTLRQRYFAWNGAFRLAADFGRLTEIGTRLGAFRNAYQKTGDIFKAMQEGRDISGDYGVKGRGMRNISPIYAFLNAKIRHAENITRSFGPENIKRTLTIGSSTIVPLTVLNWLNNNYFEGDDKKNLYRELSAWRKTLFFNIGIPGTNSFLPVPKGFYGTLFGTTVEGALDWALKNDPDVIKNLAGSLFQEYSPISDVGQVLPTAFQGIVEQIANKRLYSGQPIVPQRFEKLPEEFQFGDNTSEIIKGLGKKVGISPLRIQAFIEQYTAGTGKNILNLSDELAQLTGIIPKVPDDTFTKLSRLPVLKAFIVAPPTGIRSESGTKFYEKLDQLEEINSTVNKLVKENRDAELKDYLSGKEDDYKFYLKNQTQINKFKDVIRAVRSLQSEMYQKNETGKVEKSEALNKEILAMAQSFGEKYKEKSIFVVSKGLRNLKRETTSESYKEKRELDKLKREIKH